MWQRNSSPADAFKELYLALRLKEGRVYSKAEVADLPVIKSSHLLFKEWLIRKRSCNKLLRYIKQHSHLHNILEVGCGNGWLCARMCALPGVTVTGMDINLVELEQARQVFRDIPNLTFVEGDIRKGVVDGKKFDLIIFAASVQYFESLQDIIKAALGYLTPEGEVHIIDSNLYQPYEIAEAMQRSKIYFTQIGFPEMQRYYFHHCIHDIESFRYSILYDPGVLFNRLFRKRFFPWIAIKND